MKKGKTIYKIMTVALAVIILCLAGYIMWHRLGLNPAYDFGAGAYYYADDPAIQDMAERATYSSAVPKWIYYALFFAWGALMWFLWLWIDGRHRDSRKKM